MWGTSKIIMAHASYPGSEFYHGTSLGDLGWSCIIIYFFLSNQFPRKVMENYPRKGISLEYILRLRILSWHKLGWSLMILHDHIFFLFQSISMEDAWKIICHEYMRVWKYFIPLLNKIKKKKYILRKF